MKGRHSRATHQLHSVENAAAVNAASTQLFLASDLPRWSLQGAHRAHRTALETAAAGIEEGHSSKASVKRSSAPRRVVCGPGSKRRSSSPLELPMATAWPRSGHVERGPRVVGLRPGLKEDRE